MTEQLDYWIAEARYWRERFERVEVAIIAAQSIVRQARWQDETPPEPPVGVELGQWTHRPDGWHCSASDCRNCPAPWHEVWQVGGIGPAVPTWD